MTKLRYLFIAGILFSSTNVQAECTLKSAQTKMVETTNMMQVYNRQRVTYMEESGAVPTVFEARFTKFDDRKNELMVQFGEVTEENPDIGFDDPVDQSLCDGFDELFAQNAPDGYVVKEVNLQPTSADPNCTTTSLWNEYGVLIQKQAELAKEGKFSDAELSDMMRIGTQIGEASTTDLAQACVHLAEFGDIVNSK